ncbi:Plasmodium vivax Vir protein, putative [Plasmodium vivax]|uniref:Vir protein, putative n=1 Tax=Plasmodium vivax TaxID=5855 RepID=A0A1G4HB60_PLAVI|nr:Plasmodium vivax Vir protein, putative [Plasmodium vivax]
MTNYKDILNQYPFLGKWRIDTMDRELSNEDVIRYKEYYPSIEQNSPNYNANRPVFYGKFLRNLIELKSPGDDDNTTRSKCRKLNNWLYVISKKPGYTFDEIKSVLNLTEKFDNNIYKTYKCVFEWLSHENEFENIIKLYNFNEFIHNNKDTIIKMSIDYCPDFCQYVHGYIETYSKINKIYFNNKDNSTLCKELELFKQNYVEHVVKLEEFMGRFPYLEDTQNSYKINCVLQNQRAYCVRSEYSKLNTVGRKSQSISDQRNRGRLLSSDNKNNTKYHIFDKLHIYEESETKSETSSDMTGLNYICENAEKNTNEWDSDAIKICKDFIRLFNAMSPDTRTKTVLDTNDYKFLNFWLNKKLREKQKNDNFIENFFTYLNSKKNIFHDYNKLSGKLKNISSDEWDKMDILYNLHYNYSKIKNGNFNAGKECEEYAKNCVDKFKEATNKYPEKDNKEFYNALREFSYLYTYDQYNSLSCRNVKLPPLPKLNPPPPTTTSPNANQVGQGPRGPEQKATTEKAVKTCDEQNNTFDIVKFLNADKYHNLLKNLNVLGKYEELNNSDTLDYKTYCRDICDLEKKFPGAKALCMKTSKNLENISKKKNSERIEACEHFYYWLSDHIWNLFGKKKHIKDNPAAFNFLSIVYRTMYRLNIPECLFHYNPYDSKDILKEKKHLYYYFKYYQTIKNTITPTKVGGEDNLHCRYLNYIRDLYERYVPRCCSCFYGLKECSEYCNEYFKCDEKYYPADLLTKLGCNGEKPIKSAGEIFKNVTVNTKDLIIRRSNLTGYSFGELYKDPFYRFAFSGFTLLGILSTFFVFYKFTPVGIWLNRGRSNRRDATHAMIEEHMQELSDRRGNSPKIKSQKKRIRIAYQNN